MAGFVREGRTGSVEDGKTKHGGAAQSDQVNRGVCVCRIAEQSQYRDSRGAGGAAAESASVANPDVNNAGHRRLGNGESSDATQGDASRLAPTGRAGPRDTLADLPVWWAAAACLAFPRVGPRWCGQAGGGDRPGPGADHAASDSVSRETAGAPRSSRDWRRSASAAIGR